MSKEYRPLAPIRMADLFDGRLDKFGVYEHHEEGIGDLKCLTDGQNVLLVYENSKGLVHEFSSHIMDAPQRILWAISEEFKVDIVSEDEPQFWGYETEEELKADLAARTERNTQNFYNEVVKFVRGESHNIEPGTIGMTIAEIAKRLIAETPDLLAEDKRPDLIKAVQEKYLQHPVDI